MDRFAASRFVSDVDIKPAIAIEVEPRRGLRGMRRKHARGLGDVFESPVAIIAQKRFWKPAILAHPRAAKNEDIDMAVVIVICRDQIEAARQTGQPGLAGAISKSAVAVVAEEVHLVL